MYSPTTRLLTVLELLQSHRQMSGPEIARRLEIDVRTVRRYIGMLQDMGIPIDAERGPHGAYHLQRGHRLPPLLFSDAEAVAFTMGLLAIREYGFPVDAVAVEGALAKAERVLPQNLLQQVRSLQEAIKFHVTAPSPITLHPGLIVALSSAIQQGQHVKLRYRNGNGSETERGFDPYGIVLNEGYWYTIGHCHLRQDVRTFRLDRVVSLDLTEQTFTRPKDFDALEQVLHSISFINTSTEVEVVLETTLEHAREVIPAIMGAVEETEQGVVFRRTGSHLEWIAVELISFDFPVRIIRPDELKGIVAQMAKRALHMIDGEIDQAASAAYQTRPTKTA